MNEAKKKKEKRNAQLGFNDVPLVCENALKIVSRTTHGRIEAMKIENSNVN